MKKGNNSDAFNLRQMAEDLLKMKSVTTFSFESGTGIMKLLHELEVHQLELKIQNEELMLAKDQATAEAEKYTQLYDFAPTGYFILSKEGEIIDANHSGRKMIGNERQSIKNSRFGFYISDESKPVFNNFLNNIFKTKLKESCIVSLPAAGNKIPVYGHLTGLTDEKNENCLVNIVDITSLIQAEATLKNKMAELTFTNKELEHSLQLNVDKDLFLSTLGHDLRNQFTGLVGLSGLLMDNIRKYNVDESENITIQINKSAQSVYNLLNEILMWARTQSDKNIIKPQELNFADVCRNILEILKLNAEAKNININYNTWKDIAVFADIDMLKTILRNLISNAIKFTRKNGTININAEETSGYVTISVSDNGIGISPDNLTKLFDITQIHSTTGTAEETGTGLGLYLCKEFVEKHGGQIWAESDYGRGTVFYFSIPAKSESKIKRAVPDSEVGTRIDPGGF